MVCEIETTRVRLRPLTPADLDVLHQLWTHPRVRKYLWDSEVILPEQTASVIKTSTGLFTEKGFGLWGVTPQAANDLIGFAGYWFFRDPPELELLYGIAADHWGRGLATEAARALVRYGFEQLDFTDAPNVASVRVLEKAGLQFERRAVRGGLDTVYYRLRRERFHAADAPYRLRPAKLAAN